MTFGDGHLKSWGMLWTQQMKWRIQDFPEVGAPTLGGAQTYNFAKFPKNCMKLKEFGPPGAVHRASFRSATERRNIINLTDLTKEVISPRRDP